MSWTKKQFIQAAYELNGYSDFVFDLEPEQMQSALFLLDSMMASWGGQGVRVGYPAPSSPEQSKISDETSVPDYANLAIISNLAMLISPQIGKTISPELKQVAKNHFDSLLNKTVMPEKMKRGGFVLAGAGNRNYSRGRSPFIQKDKDQIETGKDSNIEYY